MKNLKDVIIEKLKVDDIVLDREEFPIDGTMEDMIKFLEGQGFEKVQVNVSAMLDKIFDSEKSKCFITDNNSLYKNIWFVDTSKEKILAKNPVFHIWFIKPRIYSVYYTVNSNVCEIVENDKKEFLRELNKRFGWQ